MNSQEIDSYMLNEVFEEQVKVVYNLMQIKNYPDVAAIYRSSIWRLVDIGVDIINSPDGGVS